MQITRTTAIQPLDPEERDIASIYSLVYESLVSIDDSYMPQPCLAENWIESGEGRTWTFYLRPGLTFSDGTPLTAADVVATANYILERAADPASDTKGYYSNLSYFVSRITAPDDRTVVVRAKAERTYYGILYAMTFPVLPQSQVSQPDPLGSGPYYISSFEAGHSITLEANPNWWRNMPQVRTIMLVIHSTQNEVMQSYEYGRVDAIFTRSIAAAQYKSGMTSLSLDYRTNQLEVLWINQSWARLKSVAVRKAIRYAINPDFIASQVYMGMVHRTDTPLIRGTWLYNEGLSSRFGYNPEEARRLLAEDGWADSNENGILDKLSSEGELMELDFRLYVYEEPDNNVRFETANVIKNELAEVGISIEIVTGTMTSVQEKLSAGSFHLALCSFAMDVCPDPGFLLMASNSGNYGRYRSETMTNLFKETLRKQSVRQPDYQNTMARIQELFEEDCPFVCLFFRGGTVLTRYMYTTVRDVRELELLRGIESFKP